MERSCDEGRERVFTKVPVGRQDPRGGDREAANKGSRVLKASAAKTLQQ